MIIEVLFGVMCMAVRNRLKEIRHRLCIDTKQEMAEKLGITRSMLSDYERQKVQPNIETLLRISTILQVPIEQIIYLEPDE